MNYYKELAFHLRTTRVAENRVREILEEVRDHAEESGNSPESDFGTAKDYALKFSGSAPRPLGGRILLIGVSLAIGIFTVIYLVPLFTREEIDLGFPAFWIVVPLIIASVVVGGIVDHRLPSGLTVIRNNLEV